MSPLLKAAADQGRETDTGRLGELYLRHADGAARLAYLLTGDHALAEDLVQEAFIRLAGRLVHLRDPEAFHAYLRRTVVNLANSHFRRRRVERAYLERERGVVSGRPGSGAERSVEDRDHLWAALEQLPERQRAAIVLRFYEDLSESSVAELLRCRPGTVKSLLSRGLQALREQIRAEDR
jgi:RNA polymerase sigma-70 factor (sigma-E family)